LAHAASYADGLSRWRLREFARAAECFARYADADPAAAAFLARAKKLLAHPPDPDWEPVNVLEGK
jgi:adenylate cyclase